jgi:hypothetical protein
MAHPLVDQLRFTRQELRRGLDGISEEDARRRVSPMNSVSWMVGHLAWHEQLCWVIRGQGRIVVPELEELVRNSGPASTPPLGEMWNAWQAVTEASDPFLETLTTEALQTHPVVDGKPGLQSFGTLLRRVTYHYWFHIGEALAVRQILGNQDLPEFVGDIHVQAPYRPELAV